MSGVGTYSDKENPARAGFRNLPDLGRLKFRLSLRAMLMAHRSVGGKSTRGQIEE